LYLAGHLSNAATHRACERHAAHAVATRLRGSPLVYQLGSPTPHGEARLREAGLTLRACRPGGAFDCLPWASLDEPHRIAPYLMSVGWGVMTAPLSGRGTETRYLCLFGLAIPLSERETWVS
jgi:hypothetical protein